MKLQAKLTKILGIKGLKENDIVTYRSLDDKIQFLCYLDDTQSAVIGAFGLQELKSKDLKLISRDYTLSEVLMAIRKTIIGYMLYPTPDENIVAINVKEKEICIFYNLTKTLFQQEQSTIDSIAKIMGG